MLPALQFGARPYLQRMRAFLSVAILLFCSAAFAQKVSLSTFKNWKPRNIGPAGMSGRVTSVDVVHAKPDTWIIGTASGGVWKTENAGAAWTPLFDEQPTLNIGSVTIQQSNPAVVWAGTGEGNPRNSLNLGEGIYKSMDGGKTWKRMGLEKTRNLHRIIIDPNNSDIVYVAAIGNPYGEHPERGVYKTSNGGETWSHILHTNDTSGAADMVMDPSNPNKLIVAMWQHRRTPWSFKSGGPGSGLYITMDGGKAWKKLGKEDGLPAGDFGRIGIAFARSMPSRVYAMVEAGKNGFYKSDDGGLKWELVTADPKVATNRPFYFQDIAVDTKNENRIYSIHDIVEVSEDGGKTFRTMLPYFGIHPDHHAWFIHPDNPDFILDGNDGGIGISRDRGRTWTFDDKLPVGQFYHINVDNDMPYNVMGGMQDNGSWHGPAYTWMTGGIRNYYWHNVGGGDGFDVMPDPDNSDWIYSMSQGGNLGRQNYKTGEEWYLKPPARALTDTLRFNWNAAIAQDPFDKSTIYYASQFLHKSMDKGASWTTVSPDLTTNNKVQQKQDENGGLTLDVTGAENYTTILAIAPSPKERGVIWVGTDDGNVQLTRDGGSTWTNFRDRINGLPRGAWIPQVRASRHNAGEAFVVANDYRRGDFKPYIFRTMDFGKSWTRLVDEKKVRGYALCMIQDPVEPNLIFVGTEHGLWVSMDGGASFEQWKSGYPSASTYDLAIQEREADLAIATFGRSLWILDDIRPLRKLAATNGILPAKRLTAFAAPDAYTANIAAAPGYEWSTYGLYDAENRNRGAEISYYVTPQRTAGTKQPAGKKAATTRTAVQKSDTVKTSQEQVFESQGMNPEGEGRRRDTLHNQTADTSQHNALPGDSVLVKIYNEKNEVIRNLKWKWDTGFNRQWWGMEERGFRAPNAPKPKPGAPEPGGMQALPGTYKIVLQLGSAFDSTMVTIKDDPRLQKTDAVKVAQRTMLDRLRRSADKLLMITDRLTEWEETVSKVKTTTGDGKEYEALRKSTAAISDSIKAIREMVAGKTTEKQGLSRPQGTTPLTALRQAQIYITGKSVAPGPQEEGLVQNAETLIAQVLERVNRFHDTGWKAYRQQTENTRISLFKEYSPIR